MALEGILVQNLKIATVCCDTGELALKLFKQKLMNKCCSSKFNIVFTDIQMPEMDGFRLAELIQATEHGWFSAMSKQGLYGKLKTWRNCDIVAVTAFTAEEVY
jgi:CheY-like chemotaxis protein